MKTPEYEYKIDVAWNTPFSVYRRRRGRFCAGDWEIVKHGSGDTVADCAKLLQDIKRVPLYYDKDGKRT